MEQQEAQAAVVRRRRRPAVSCVTCRRRKIRCDRKEPCSNCLKSKDSTCSYRDRAPPPAPVLLSPPSTTATTTTSTSATSQTNDCANEDHDELDVATCFSLTAPPTPLRRVDTAILGIAGTFHIHHESRQGQPNVGAVSITHKTRYCGQSHWVNSIALVRDMFSILEPHFRNNKSHLFECMQDCKSLSRTLKARAPSYWPCETTFTPPQDHENLLESYISTSESLFRVLHIPSITRDFHALCTSASSSTNTTFLVQAKLICAIGAAHTDTVLRQEATQWVQEAQLWLSKPDFKHQLTLQHLQSHILLLLAQNAVCIGEDMIWVSVGSLVRRAMYMGLHRDGVTGTSPNSNLFSIEMRRRLWNTILELSVQSSLDSGGPPLVSVSDFDTKPPSNLNDEDLASDNASPKPEATFTSTTISIALRKTIPVRLAIVKFLNDLSSPGDYQTALKLDSDFRGAYSVLAKFLSPFSHSGNATVTNVNRHAVVTHINLLLRRHLLALHLPFLLPALSQPEFSFSRMVVVDTCHRLWRDVFPTAGSGASNIVTTASCFRAISVQVIIVLSAHLRAELNDPIFGGMVREDLLEILEEAKRWTWRCIEGRETNVKGYLFACLIKANVDAMREGLAQPEVVQRCVQAAEGAMCKAKGVLVRRLQTMTDTEPSTVVSIAADDQGPSFGGGNKEWEQLQQTFDFFGDADGLQGNTGTALVDGDDWFLNFGNGLFM
ncbi:putative transcription factor [Triangularia verruculosa]|uniref:Transcription factor n=1 Tax=Triangularia verruculosa TaxID=2587418 RepID=A0AAN6XQJ1_9PEZI|nr:putative transcription factor [Triangularia verruculosa]